MEKAHGFLDDAINAMDEKDEPFFLTVAPIAPHSDVIIRRKIISGQVSNQSATQAPPIPADRHKHLFEDAVVPRTPNFNPDTPGGASWIAKLPQQDEENVEYNDDWYRNRLRTLQVVDEMVESLISRLSEAGILENTYIFYSTDNGYSIGQHRRQPGKQCAFEEDINVPLIVRGPGIPQGLQRDLVTTHTDLAPTFLSLANAAPPSKFELDGQAIPLSPFQPASNGNVDAVPASVLDWPQEHVNVEMWGIIMSEGKYGMVQYPNHTYKALRIVGRTYNLLYTIWCSNEHELYDMTVSEHWKPPHPRPILTRRTERPLSARQPIQHQRSTRRERVNNARKHLRSLLHSHSVSAAGQHNFGISELQRSRFREGLSSLTARPSPRCPAHGPQNLRRKTMHTPMGEFVPVRQSAQPD